MLAMAPEETLTLAIKRILLNDKNPGRQTKSFLPGFLFGRIQMQRQ